MERVTDDPQVWLPARPQLRAPTIILILVKPARLRIRTSQYPMVKGSPTLDHGVAKPPYWVPRCHLPEVFPRTGRGEGSRQPLAERRATRRSPRRSVVPRAVTTASTPVGLPGAWGSTSCALTTPAASRRGRV